MRMQQRVARKAGYVQGLATNNNASLAAAYAPMTFYEKAMANPSMQQYQTLQAAPQNYANIHNSMPSSSHGGFVQLAGGAGPLFASGGDQAMFGGNMGG